MMENDGKWFKVSANFARPQVSGGISFDNQLEQTYPGYMRMEISDKGTPAVAVTPKSLSDKVFSLKPGQPIILYGYAQLVRLRMFQKINVSIGENFRVLYFVVNKIEIPLKGQRD